MAPPGDFTAAFWRSLYNLAQDAPATKRRAGDGGESGLYQQHILPWLIHFGVRQQQLAPLRDSWSRGRDRPLAPLGVVAGAGASFQLTGLSSSCAVCPALPRSAPPAGPWPR